MSAGNNFEEPLIELRRRIEELSGYPEGSGHDGRAGAPQKRAREEDP